VHREGEERTEREWPSVAILHLEESLNASGDVLGATSQRWRRADRLAPPSAGQLQEWRDFLGTLPDTVSPPLAAAIRATWEAIARTAPGAALPGVLPSGDGGARLTWDSGRYRFDVDVRPGGDTEWFFRDRVTSESDGTEGEGEATLPARAIELLRRFA
jgi:hypothetical protein